MASLAFAAESLGEICWSLHQVVVLLGIPSNGHEAWLIRVCGGDKIAASCERYAGVQGRRRLSSGAN